MEGAPLTAEEKIELASKPKEINPVGTRFSANPFKEPAVPNATPVLIYGKAKGIPGEVIERIILLVLLALTLLSLECQPCKGFGEFTSHTVNWCSYLLVI